MSDSYICCCRVRQHTPYDPQLPLGVESGGWVEGLTCLSDAVFGRRALVGGHRDQVTRSRLNRSLKSKSCGLGCGKWCIILKAIYTLNNLFVLSDILMRPSFLKIQLD